MSAILLSLLNSRPVTSRAISVLMLIILSAHAVASMVSGVYSAYSYIYFLKYIPCYDLIFLIIILAAAAALFIPWPASEKLRAKLIVAGVHRYEGPENIQDHRRINNLFVEHVPNIVLKLLGWSPSGYVYAFDRDPASIIVFLIAERKKSSSAHFKISGASLADKSIKYRLIDGCVLIKGSFRASEVEYLP